MNRMEPFDSPGSLRVRWRDSLRKLRAGSPPRDCSHQVLSLTCLPISPACGPFVAQRTPHATPSSPALQASHTRTLINPYQSGRREASLAHLPDKQSRGELFTPSCCWAIRRVRNPPHASTTSVVPLPRTGGLSSGRSLPQANAILCCFTTSPLPAVGLLSEPVLSFEGLRTLTIPGVPVA